MTHKTIHLTVQIVLILIMAAIAICSYHLLPEIIAIHWNFAGEADWRGHKLSLLLGIPSISIALLALMKYLPQFDPKKEKYELFQSEYLFLQTLLLGFFTYLFTITIISNLYDISITKYILIGLGSLFMLMGNMMGKIRQNYFVWLKTPWTLSNENVWNKSHRMMGIIRVIGWFLFIINAFVQVAVPIVSIMIIAIMVIVPVTYSYMVYKQK